jgi:2-succinyl-6-hydroxy-2,4-cyclohexadiene-1-carboxylate synthase
VVHGFTQTGRGLGPMADELAQLHRVVRVDLPGHGGSSEIRADAETTAALVLEAAGESETVDLIGYSLGARLCLQAALLHPERVRHLVLISGSPGIADEEAREERRSHDNALADALETSGDVEEFLVRWLANPMFAHLTPDQAELLDRQRNTAAGLASSLRLAGTGAQRSLWGELPTLSLPVLLVSGANDPRFSSIASQMSSALPNAVLSLIPGAGHAAHLEQPGLTARVIGQWLDTTLALSQHDSDGEQ